VKEDLVISGTLNLNQEGYSVMEKIECCHVMVMRPNSVNYAVKENLVISVVP
jgi:hypothetical protein